MKTLLSAFLFGATLSACPLQLALADDAGSTNAPASTNLAGGGSDDQRAQRMEKLKAFLDQLDLSDDQKAKIKAIRANTQPGRERRQQIMAVLTPEQKEKLKQMIQAHRDGSGT